MKKRNTVADRLTWLWSGVIILIIFVAAGCEPYDLLPEDTAGTETAQPAAPTPETPATPTPETPVTPEPAPEPVAPAPVPQTSFRWEPRAGSIRVVIPASLAHWQFIVVTRIQHHTLYGPDNRAGNKDVDVEYILPGGPDVWAARASSLDSRGGEQLLVYVNTRDMQATGHRSAGWRILDPHKTYVGDSGIRLQPGENK